MDKRIGIGILVMTFIALAAAYIFVIPKGTLFAMTGQCEDKMLVPILGRIACEPVDGVGVLPYSAIGFSEGTAIRVRCGDNENSDKCEVKVSCGPYSWFGIPYNTVKQIKYRVNTNQAWTISCSEFPTGNECRLTEINNGDTVEVACMFGSGADIYGPGTVKEYYQPYKLYQYVGGGKEELWHTAGVYSCDLMTLSDAIRGQLCYDGIAPDPSGNKVSCTSITGTTVLPYGAWVNFVSDWVPTPFDLTAAAKATYNGQKVYCSLGKLYSLGQVTTRDTCYTYPSTYLTTVACCPGQLSQGAYCGDDFLWHSSGGDEPGPSCISDMQCLGSGKFVCDYTSSPLTAMKYGCVEGKCQEAGTIQVACCPPNIGCPTGQLCNGDSFTCEGGTGGEVICGDDICSRPYEDEFSCESDCGKIIDDADLMAYVIMALITLGCAIGIGHMADWGASGYIFGGIIGVIVSLILNWLADIPAWVYLLIGIFGAGLIGIFLWVGGLGFLAVVIAYFAKNKKKR